MDEWLPVGSDSRFLVHPTPLNGLLVVKRQPRCDDRGAVERLFCPTLFETCFPGRTVRQVNRTITHAKGTVRGMHFQSPPHAELKFVQCLRGAVYDVVVDLRRGSTTFLQWHAEHLSQDNSHGLLIPEGFAHGLQTLEDETELLYVHSADYVSGSEGGIDALEPRLNIPWPLEVTDRSPRDRTHPALDDQFEGISV